MNLSSDMKKVEQDIQFREIERLNALLIELEGKKRKLKELKDSTQNLAKKSAIDRDRRPIMRDIELTRKKLNVLKKLVKTNKII